MINFKMTAPRFALPAFNRQEMQRIGETQLRAQKARIALGVNTSDQRAKPLNPRYAWTKAHRGAQPIRDMKLTGRTLAALGIQTIQSLSPGVSTIVLGFRDTVAERKAYFGNAIDEMVGNSPRDTEAVMKAIEAELPQMMARVILAAEIIELLS